MKVKPGDKVRINYPGYWAARESRDGDGSAEVRRDEDGST